MFYSQNELNTKESVIVRLKYTHPHVTPPPYTPKHTYIIAYHSGHVPHTARYDDYTSLQYITLVYLQHVHSLDAQIK